MNYHQLKTIFPNASEQFLRDNASNAPAPDHRVSGAVVERRLANESVASDEAQTRDSGKYVVRVTSHRVRLLDEDNLCEKFHIDALRYAGCLPVDSPDRCRIITTQAKVRRKTEERTEIVIVRVSADLIDRTPELY